MRLDSADHWSTKWHDIFDEYQKDLRHAHYVSALLKPREKALLELGAGSFRDMATLCRWGKNCVGIDYSAQSVEMAKQKHAAQADRMHSMDAFCTSFHDKEFDFSYHNGLWGYFDDAEIDLLLAEQARITKYRVVATLHNAHNKQFSDFFHERKNSDPLYDIRFFTVEQATTIMSKQCRRVDIYPVGAGIEDKLIRKRMGRLPFLLPAVLEANRQRHLAHGERLLCVGTL